jgi:hypothetical protein
MPEIKYRSDIIIPEIGRLMAKKHTLFNDPFSFYGFKPSNLHDFQGIFYRFLCKGLFLSGAERAQ